MKETKRASLSSSSGDSPATWAAGAPLCAFPGYVPGHRGGEHAHRSGHRLGPLPSHPHVPLPRQPILG